MWRWQLTLAGKARAMAGPKPFHSAVTPSAAISLRAQSTKPVYVPEGADCNLDLIVWASLVSISVCPIHV